MAKRSLRITARFAIVLVVLVPALLAILGVGLQGLQSGRHWADTLYADRLVTSQTVTELDIALEDAHEATLGLLLADNAADRQRLTNSLLTQISPRVENALAAVTRQVADNPAELAATQTVTAHWAHFQQLLVTVASASASPAARSATATQVTTMLDAASNSALSIIRMEGIQGKKAHEAALGVYRSSVILMLIAGALGLICTVGVVGWLIRSVLPRTLAYSAFAADVSRGDYSGHLRPSGDDELAQLGRVLEGLAQRREAEDAYDHRQLELIETLQLTESQQEANDLLKRHLERAVAGNRVTILNRDNGADRLQAVTAIAPESPLAAALQSATPRSCLAVRKATPHTATPDDDSLLGCSVCSGCPGHTTCTPLIVSGEVIGSVLCNHESPLDESEQRSIREAVTLAAPVMGNQRNLAIAELRATTDSLTGLPNKRAINDAMRRMVAQSDRTKTPLATLMIDLDHFKSINDEYGHGAGDSVLAAVGASLAGRIRASDLAGRYGGEEFLVLLPDTDIYGAKVLAEKLRGAVAAIHVPTVDRAITASIGVAILPDHAIDASSLWRAADRALYVAKNAGRDRVEVFNIESVPAKQDVQDAEPDEPDRSPTSNGRTRPAGPRRLDRTRASGGAPT